MIGSGRITGLESAFSRDHQWFNCRFSAEQLSVAGSAAMFLGAAMLPGAATPPVAFMPEFAQ
jgi:hypothetical protein